MGISFNFYSPEKKEKAPPLPNSSGNLKKRLHFFGPKENDRFAVAVSKQISSKSMPKLNWFEKKFYVLVPDPNSNNETWYKVNKNSLKKRFQITEKELKQSPILDLIQEKYLARKEWEQITDEYINNKGSYPPNSLASRFIDALVNAGIKPEKYKGVAFWNQNLYHFFFTADGIGLFDLGSQKDDRPLNLRNYEKGEILSVIYREHVKVFDQPEGTCFFHGNDPNYVSKMDFLTGPDSPLTVIELDEASVKTIIMKGEFPEKILKQIK